MSGNAWLDWHIDCDSVAFASGQFEEDQEEDQTCGVCGRLIVDGACGCVFDESEAAA